MLYALAITWSTLPVDSITGCIWAADVDEANDRDEDEDGDEVRADNFSSSSSSKALKLAV